MKLSYNLTTPLRVYTMTANEQEMFLRIELRR